MANEFKVKNGLYVSGSTTITNNTTITGSLVVSGGITGSLLGTSSYATNALTASYALVAAAGGFPYTGSAQITGSLGVTGSVSVTGIISGSVLNNPSSSLMIISGSINPTGSATGASIILVNTVMSASANNQTLVGLDINPTFTNGAFTGVKNIALRVVGHITPSLNNTYDLGTSTSNFNIVYSSFLAGAGLFTINTYNGNSQQWQVSGVNKMQLFGSSGNLLLQNGGTFTDAGYRLDVSGSTRLNGNTQITGSLNVSGSITTTGTITAQTLVVQTVSSSIIYSSGSNIFGNSLANTQALTGSVSVTGSLAVNGSNVILTNQTSSMSVATASFATTASYVANASSFPFTGSAIITGSLVVTGSVNSTLGFTGSLLGTATTASYVLQAVSASYATFALTASSAPGYTVSFTQSSAATTWSFTHNMNTRNPIVQVYGSDYKQIIPNDIVGVNVNTAEIRFDYATTGYVIMSNGGGLYVTGSTSLLNQTSAATTWSFTHNLNSKYVNFEVYDSNDYVIIPAGIRAIDVNTAELHFAGATAGKAVANFSGINGAPNATTASYALTATSASYAVNATSASYLNPIVSSYVVLTQVSQSLNFVDDAAAAAGGIPLGGLYRNGNFILIRIS